MSFEQVVPKRIRGATYKIRMTYQKRDDKRGKYAQMRIWMSEEVLAEMDWVCGIRVVVSFGSESDAGKISIRGIVEGEDGYKLCGVSGSAKTSRSEKEGTVCNCSIQFTPEPWHLRTTFPSHVQAINPKFEYRQHDLLIHSLKRPEGNDAQED